MMKKRTGLGMLLVAMTMVFAVGCSSSSEKATNEQTTQKAQKFAEKIEAGSLVYASYAQGHYTLYGVDQSSLAVKGKLSLDDGWGDTIYQDNQHRIWAPVFYKPDMTTNENFVDVVDPANAKSTRVQVGKGPKQVFFTDKGAYVVCQEDGENPTIYLVDENLKATKWKTIEHGGLINGADFDGSTIYFSALHNDKDVSKQAPLLVRVPLQGDYLIKKESEEPRGFNNLHLQNGKLYMGMQSEDGSISEFDAKTLARTRSVSASYQDMVGDMLTFDTNTMVVSNYSKTQQKGNSISFMNIKDGGLVSVFSTTNNAEHLSYIDGKFYAVDNLKLKLEVLDKTGKSEKIVDTPTQVTNLVKLK
ncbi:MAG: hypothetical protein ACXVO1_05730 [Tumebacillaceae bacterium]